MNFYNDIEKFIRGGYLQGSKQIDVPQEITNHTSLFDNLQLMTVLKIVATLIGIIGMILKVTSKGDQKSNKRA